MEATTSNQQVLGATLGNPTYRVKCPECNVEYTTMQGLKKHAILIHGQCNDHATMCSGPGEGAERIAGFRTD